MTASDSLRSRISPNYLGANHLHNIFSIVTTCPSMKTGKLYIGFISLLLYRRGNSHPFRVTLRIPLPMNTYQLTEYIIRTSRRVHYTNEGIKLDEKKLSLRISTESAWCAYHSSRTRTHFHFQEPLQACGKAPIFSGSRGSGFLCLSARNWHGTHITLAKHVPWHHTAKNRFKPFPKRIYTGVVLRPPVL